MSHGGRRRSARAALAATCLVVLACHVAPVLAGKVEAGVALSSDYVVRGLTRSLGEPAVQAQLGWTGDRGWTTGVWASTVNLNPGPGPTRELDLYAGRRWSVGKDWAFHSELTGYTFGPKTSERAYNYAELRGAMSFRDCVEIAMAWSPDYTASSLWGYTHEQAALTYEASARFPANRWLTFNGGAGHLSMQGFQAASYWYWSAGAELGLDRVSLAMNYIGTSRAALEYYGSPLAGSRVAATLTVRIR